MINKVIDTINEYKMLKNGDRVIAALSGGADSVCLLLVMCDLKERFELSLEAVHINHCIRGCESDNDERFCVELCKSLDIPIKVYSVDIPELAEKYGRSLEETARDVRYEKFSEFGNDCKIATAHTLSDNAETVILNLIRGTGLKGLCGIPPVRGNIIRPLIAIDRHQIEDYLTEKKQNYVTDSTNLSDDYTRNKIRHNIIPIMLEINKGFYKSFSNSLKAIKEENDFIEKITNEFYEKNCRNGIISAGSETSEVIKKRAVSRFLNENGLPVSFEKINRTAALADNNGSINISKDAFIKGRNGNIFIEKKQPEISEIEVPLKIGQNRIFKNRILTAELVNINNDKNIIDIDKVSGKIILRNRRFGDRIKLAGRGFTSSVKKLLNENVNIEKRRFIHFLCDDKGLIFMEGFGISDRVKADENSKKFLKITIKED